MSNVIYNASIMLDGIEVNLDEIVIDDSGRWGDNLFNYRDYHKEDRKYFEGYNDDSHIPHIKNAEDRMVETYSKDDNDLLFFSIKVEPSHLKNWQYSEGRNFVISSKDFNNEFTEIEDGYIEGVVYIDYIIDPKTNKYIDREDLTIENVTEFIKWDFMNTYGDTVKIKSSYFNTLDYSIDAFKLKENEQSYVSQFDKNINDKTVHGLLISAMNTGGYSIIQSNKEPMNIIIKRAEIYTDISDVLLRVHEEYSNWRYRR